MKKPNLASISLAAALGATAAPALSTNLDGMDSWPTRTTEHRGADDLLTAGLGLAGLRSPIAPPFANPEAPTPEEARRRAIWSNWRGIADLSEGGGYELYGKTVSVFGREVSTLATLKGAKHGHRIVVQIPDAFDKRRRCVVVAPASGSRGVYGAIAVAGPWGLTNGCVVAYTDKGAGTDYFDLDANAGSSLEGTPAVGMDAVFKPEAAKDVKPNEIAIKHAHSGDNPEADWGRHVVQAAKFALATLSKTFPDETPYAFDNTKVIAVGISNGGGAVLRAAEIPEAKFAAIVAGEPQVFVEGFGSRSILDYSTEAATFMACAQLALPEDALPQPPMLAAAKPLMGLWCQRLKMAGVLEGETVEELAKNAHAKMIKAGWTDASLAAGFASTGFDLWRSVLATYISAYSRAKVGENPCGFRFEAEDPATKASRVTTAAERAVWWTDASGIAPGAGVTLKNDQPDIYQQIQCIAKLAEDPVVKASVLATRAEMPHNEIPVMIVHGQSDGLLPINMTSIPYARKAVAEGKSNIRIWSIANVQHFDGFLGFPGYGAKYLPMLPYVYRALDQVMANIENDTIPLPKSREIETKPRGPGVPLTLEHLNLP